ncbi:hypothetical protein EJD97_020119 [Solanum chilense]|uniref:Uncharacterized protein n=1 Tax=Solanum chilense TaxID=4083 RepID=A0A6N2C539_SOLCI|nr:hypothetical protein EJD97_020119 [Solanum chilense]
MNNRKNATWRLEEDIANAGAPSVVIKFLLLRKGQEKGGQAKASGSSDACKKNRFYVLHSRGEQETFFDVVTGMLKVFSINVYAYLIPVLPYNLLHL